MAELLARLEGRFDAKLEKGLTGLRDGLRAEIGGLLAEMGGQMGGQMGALRAEMSALGTEMNALRTEMNAMRTGFVTKEQFADFRTDVSDKFADLLKWMVVLWTGTVLAVITTGFLT